MTPPTPTIHFPCLTPQWVPIGKAKANDYNPNKVESEEMELLKLSIEIDGLTQPVVAWWDMDSDTYIIIDGFHRFYLLRNYFKVSHFPAVVLDKTMTQRIASTIRHNRARGKHQISLMEALVRRLADMGWKNAIIAKHLGMKPEEVLRLKQIGGIAQYYAHRSYSRAWVWIDAPDGLEPIEGNEEADNG